MDPVAAQNGRRNRCRRSSNRPGNEGLPPKVRCLRHYDHLTSATPQTQRNPKHPESDIKNSPEPLSPPQERSRATITCPAQRDTGPCMREPIRATSQAQAKTKGRRNPGPKWRQCFRQRAPLAAHLRASGNPAAREATNEATDSRSDCHVAEGNRECVAWYHRQEIKTASNEAGFKFPPTMRGQWRVLATSIRAGTDPKVAVIGPRQRRNANKTEEASMKGAVRAAQLRRSPSRQRLGRGHRANGLGPQSATLYLLLQQNGSPKSACKCGLKELETNNAEENRNKEVDDIF